MLGLLKKLFGGGDGGVAETHQGEPEAYEGFDITPSPTREAQGWRVGGTITREVDGETRTHLFIRADVCSNLDEAVATSLAKAKRLVDEQGVRMFDSAS